MNFASSCIDGKNHLLCKMIGRCAGEEWEPITGKLFWEPSQRDKQCIFPIGITEQSGKVSTSMWYRKNWGAALCLLLRRRLNFHFFVAGFAHEFGLHSMPKIRARTQPFKNICLAWKPIEQGFENSIHSLVMVALSQKKPWTHI